MVHPGQHGTRGGGCRRSLKARRNCRQRLPPLEVLLEGSVLGRAPESADGHAVVVDLGCGGGVCRRRGGSHGEVILGLGLLQELLEDLVDVSALLGGALDIAVLPVEGHGGLERVVRDVRVAIHIAFVTHDDDGDVGIFGLVDHVSEAGDLFPGVGVIQGEDDYEGVR